MYDRQIIGWSIAIPRRKDFESIIDMKLGYVEEWHAQKPEKV